MQLLMIESDGAEGMAVDYSGTLVGCRRNF